MSGDGDQSAEHRGGNERKVASSWLVLVKGKLEVLSLIIEDSLVKSFSGDLASQSCYLTAVLPSFPVSRAYKYMRDVLPEPCLLVHGLTLGVVDDGEGDLLQDGWEGPVCNDVFCQDDPRNDQLLYLHKVGPSQ